MRENKDFYVIELKSKIKVGITHSFKKRFSSIKTGSGIKDNEIINKYHYPDLGFLEAPIKRLFSKHRIAGEWFYKKGIVLNFVESLKDGNIPTIELFRKIQNDSVKETEVFKIKNNNYENFEILKENAINLLQQIKSERFGIGYPESIELAKFIKTKKANYRNMVYYVDDDFKYLERVPKFTIDEMKDSQIIECLRIIKNVTPNNKVKVQLQDKIDSIFSRSDLYRLEIIELIKSFFFDKNYLEKSDVFYQNIEMEYDEEVAMYSMNNFEDLSKDEILFLKNVKKHNLMVSIFGTINFEYKTRGCGCSFKVENFLRVLNFFSITKIENNQIRLYFNDTNHNELIFQFKYHLLNSSEKNFLQTLKINDHSSWYVEFEKNGKIYYCLFDNMEDVLKDLKIDKKTA